MKRMIVVFGGVAALLLSASSTLAAQQRSMVSGPRLEAAVVERGAERARDQAVVTQFLQRQDVREAGARLGLSSEDLTAQVGSIGTPELRDLAEQVRGAEAQLAGGDTLVISSTVIIIALLILIIILVAD